MDKFDFKKYNKTHCTPISDKALIILSKYYGRTMTQQHEFSSKDDEYGHNCIEFEPTN